jgi:hypothetical protein
MTLIERSSLSFFDYPGRRTRRRRRRRKPSDNASLAAVAASVLAQSEDDTLSHEPHLCQVLRSAFLSSFERVEKRRRVSSLFSFRL